MNKLPRLIEVEIERLGNQLINSAFFVSFDALIILGIAAANRQSVETIEDIPRVAADAETHAAGTEAWFAIQTSLLKLMPMLSDECNALIKVFDEDVKTL